MKRERNQAQLERHAAQEADRRLRYKGVADASTLEEKLGIIATLIAGSITLQELKTMSTTQRISALCALVQRLQVAQGAQQANDLLKLLKTAHAASMARIAGKEVRSLSGFQVDKPGTQAIDAASAAP